MVKLKKTSSFVCQECGYDSPAFMGKCPECGNWNSFKEIRVAPETIQMAGGIVSNQFIEAKNIGSIVYSETSRIKTNFTELDTVLGGGIVKGSAILLAGDPGVGKSTLLLQLCMQIAGRGEKVLYISGEESAEQIKMRADRIASSAIHATSSGGSSKEKANENLFILSISDPDRGVEAAFDMKPSLVIVDSVQTMQSVNVASLSGSVGQVRYAALHFIRAAKQLSIPTILVGHVTKEGMVAGPMVLSHMVDTVLFLEGEKASSTRLLRSLKNRFGPVDEVGIFQMEEEGMKDVKNPEQIFLGDVKTNTAPGSVLVATLEGSRSFLVELQALVVYSKLPMPRRVVSGLDQRRVELLLAVLQKHVRLPLETYDVFVNVAGGMKLSDPAVDVGVCLAVYSSLKNVSLADTVGISEVGLLGELRSVTGLEKRIKQAEKLGYKNVITAKTHKSLAEAIMTLDKKVAH